MNELPVQPGSEEQDEDAHLRRETGYYAQQLGDEWEAVEPGIYRFVGRSTPPSEAIERSEDLGDALAPRTRHKPEYDLDEHPATEGKQRRRP